MPHSWSPAGAVYRWTVQVASNRFLGGQLTWSQLKDSSRYSSPWSRTCQSRHPRMGSMDNSVIGEPSDFRRPDRSLQTAARAEPVRPERDIASDVSCGNRLLARLLDPRPRGRQVLD